jgi:hypothetical protein
VAFSIIGMLPLLSLLNMTANVLHFFWVIFILDTYRTSYIISMIDSCFFTWIFVRGTSLACSILYSRLLFSRFWVGFFVLNGTLAIFVFPFSSKDVENVLCTLVMMLI